MSKIRVLILISSRLNEWNERQLREINGGRRDWRVLSANSMISMPYSLVYNR